MHQPSRSFPTDEYVMLSGCGELECCDEVVECEHKEEWLAVI